MASEDGLMSPESSVTSLLASSGPLQSSLHPEPVPFIKYRDRHYISASEALDAYITDFQRSLRDAETTTGKLELPKERTKPRPRNRDVLKTSLTDEELVFLNIPVRNRDSDRLSMTTDDLLVLPNDGSLPVTRTSALLSRSGSFPMGLSFNSSSRSHSRSIMSHKHSVQRPVTAASRKPRPVDDLLTDSLQSQCQAPPPDIPPANRTLPPRSRHLPRWMTSQKSEMDFSGMSSVPELKYPEWLRQCEGSSEGQQSDRPLPHRVPSWVGELEESSGDSGGQRGVKGHAGGPYGSQSIGQSSLRDLRLQFEQKLQAAKRRPIHEGPLFKDDKTAPLIFRAEQMLNSPSFSLCEPLKELNSSGDTEDALDADRSWDNPPVTFKPPVPVGGADEPPAPEELQRSKSAASCSSGYSSRKHPGPVEALKHMLFRLQAVEHKISQSHASSDAKTPASSAAHLERDAPEPQTEEADLGNVESLQRALHHLDRLKTLVDDMNERKASAEHDGTDCTDTPVANITDRARINKHL
ncbi:lung adenoma susceptibility protein 2-like isoform X4 [Carassius auratus]|uniref:Lung adenoma susceptibility protein 2-like isoform X4 n=1 Tax=Carassius auratus TaxID=7957 RepID=A0A6P6NM08_CARAU|nr:lung adenoma susceptibility protein 2-like isoform X4 [Carassius auratus]